MAANIPTYGPSGFEFRPWTECVYIWICAKFQTFDSCGNLMWGRTDFAPGPAFAVQKPSWKMRDDVAERVFFCPDFHQDDHSKSMRVVSRGETGVRYKTTAGTFLAASHQRVTMI